MSDIILKVLCVILLGLGLYNFRYVVHGKRLYNSVYPRSPLLFAYWIIKVVIWFVGLYFAVLAVDVFFDLPSLPFVDIGLGIAILIIELLPSFLHRQMIKFIDRQEARDIARDKERDATHDQVENEARDEVRDEARDTGRDYIRDPARDEARDIEHDAKDASEAGTTGEGK